MTQLSNSAAAMRATLEASASPEAVAALDELVDDLAGYLGEDPAVWRGAGIAAAYIGDALGTFRLDGSDPVAIVDTMLGFVSLVAGRAATLEARQ